MRKIIASIDIDSDSIKFIIGEFCNKRLNILSASKISNRRSSSEESTKEDIIASIREAIKEASNRIGVDIKKVLLGLDTRNLKLVKSVAEVEIKSEDHIITHDDINDVINQSSKSKIPSNYALVGTIPVEFLIGEEKPIKNPLGKESEKLSVKTILALSPKDYIQGMLELLEQSGVRVVDIVLNPLGDYYMFKDTQTSKSVGSVINLGYDVSMVSVFNRGILTNTKCIGAGSKSVIKDIAYIYKIDFESAKGIYNDLALASSRLANANDYRVVTNLEGKSIQINQYEVSEIAATRIEDILEELKKQINILTKKQISYIIVTGGLTELKDFSIILEKVMGKDVVLGDVKTIGARDNNFSSSIGIIKYYNEKCELIGKNTSVLSESEIDKMNNGGSEESDTHESLFGKVFGYFFES